MALREPFHIYCQVPKGSPALNISKVVLASGQHSENYAMAASQCPMVLSSSCTYGGMRAARSKCPPGEVAAKQVLYQHCSGALEIPTAPAQGLYSVSQADTVCWEETNSCVPCPLSELYS